MEELLKTNNAVLISFVEAVLGEAGIHHIVLDQNMSIMDGSLGVLPRRVMVETDALSRARRLLDDAGISAELSAQNGRQP